MGSLHAIHYIMFNVYFVALIRHAVILLSRPLKPKQRQYELGTMWRILHGQDLGPECNNREPTQDRTISSHRAFPLFPSHVLSLPCKKPIISNQMSSRTSSSINIMATGLWDMIFTRSLMRGQKQWSRIISLLQSNTWCVFREAAKRRMGWTGESHANKTYLRKSMMSAFQEHCIPE